MEIEAIREERSPVLIATFVDGYTVGWRFALPESFKDALDIKQTARKIAGRTENIWTQGNQFNFIQGSILYDTRLAYDLEWGEALKHMKLSVQISEVTPSEYAIQETLKTAAEKLEILVLSKGEESKAKRKTLNDGLLIKRTRMQFGRLKFKLYRPKKDLSAVEEIDGIECDQEEFVAFLQTGRIRTTDNKTRDLFKEFSR